MSGTKRQNLPEGLWPGLWVVATPIGNLADLSPRGRLALESADVVLCEDTRRTSQLLSTMGIQAKLARFDAHSSEAQVREWVRRLAEGESFALVTDAGTPGVSDPGAALVAAAHDAGIRVSPIPGPSAPAALVSISGFQATAFAFRGFFPRKEGERKEELELARSSDLARVVVWFESPQRVQETLEWLAATLGEQRVVAAKELTKLHESIWAGNASEVAARVREEIESEGSVGEWCFAVHFTMSVEKSSEWVKALQCLLDARITASEAAKRVSQTFGVAKNEAYERALQLSGKKS